MRTAVANGDIPELANGLHTARHVRVRTFEAPRLSQEHPGRWESEIQRAARCSFCVFSHGSRRRSGVISVAFGVRPGGQERLAVNRRRREGQPLCWKGRPCESRGGCGKRCKLFNAKRLSSFTCKRVPLDSGRRTFQTAKTRPTCAAKSGCSTNKHSLLELATAIWPQVAGSVGVSYSTTELKFGRTSNALSELR